MLGIHVRDNGQNRRDPRMHYDKWTNTEIKTLCLLIFSGYKVTKIAEHLNRSESAVRNRVYFLNINLHGNRCKKIQKKCRQCGGLFAVYPSESDQKYCSRECYGDFLSENQNGDQNPMWEKKIIVECYFCGQEIALPPWHYKRSKTKRFFCDGDCQKRWQAEERIGHRSPRWRGGPIVVECAECGENIERIRSEVRKRDRHFCCLEHLYEWERKNWAGEDHPLREMTDIQRKLRESVSAQLRRGLVKKDKGSIFKKLPYTAEDLKEHLEKQFIGHMSWDNYGSAWHIDHIRPVSSFDFTAITDDEFLKCWSLANLRPLWAKSNLKKSNKWNGQTNLLAAAEVHKHRLSNENSDV